MTTRMKNFMGGRKETAERERRLCRKTRKKETKWTETTKKEVRRMVKEGVNELNIKKN